jgi:hypothetical protein
MQFSLRTLLILTAIGPPALAGLCFAPYLVWYFTAILFAAFLLFLVALGATVLIRRIVGIWTP